MTLYKGYLIKIKGKGELPKGFIIDYNSTPDQETDLNSYTDPTGETHRNILEHKKSSITFILKPMTLEEKIVFQEFLPGDTVTVLEYWNDKINNYKEGKFYIPPVNFPIRANDSKTIYYNSITMELIEY